MINPYDSTTSQHFDIVRIGRAIEQTRNQSELRELAHHLLSAWKAQRDATNWLLGHQFRLPDAGSHQAATRLLEAADQSEHEVE